MSIDRSTIRVIGRVYAIMMHLRQSVSRFEPKNEYLERLANLFLSGKNRYACVALNEGRVVGLFLCSCFSGYEVVIPL